MKTVIITSIPSPYRVTVFDELNTILGKDFLVIYLSETHVAFKWKKCLLKHNHVFLNEQTKSNINSKEGIYYKLKKLNPDVVITCGFNPTMLKAMVFSIINKKKLIANTDAWELNERSYSIFHILIRKILYKKMQAFIPVSHKGYLNFLRYNLKKEQIFISHYAIDNEYSAQFINTEKNYDILFSGQFIDRKMPFFFCDVVEELSKINKSLKVLLLGDGELRPQVIERLKLKNINYTYLGFVQKEDLPRHYASARLFLFPTKLDSWGVVANDACSVGTPVVTCENAGSANDLIIHNYNGYVLPLDIKIWVNHINTLLNNNNLYTTFSENCLSQIQKFNPKEASEGIINAINFAIK